MKHPANKAARPAFTLVEMLIVISIIGLLAALLFPVFARVREGARATSCNSNLRQLGLAFTQYAQDYGGRFPGTGDAYQPPGNTGACFASTCNGWQAGKGHWVSGVPTQFLAETDPPFAPKKDNNNVINKADVEGGALFSYVKSASTFYCPSDPYGSDKKLSYSMNCALTLLSQTRIRTPADIVLLVDEQGANDGYFWAVNSDGTANGAAFGVSKVSVGKSTDQLTTRHNGGGNLLYVDGHVKFFQFNQFPLDSSPQGLANKWKTAGSPRFHDRAFGKYGSNTPPGIGTGRYMNDFCDASAGPGSADGTANIP